MKLGTIAIAASGLALGLATWITPGNAQGPLWDVVHVNLPYTVSIGDKTLQPGEYTIQQNRDPGGASRVLLIYSDNGMKFETSAMTIPALDPNTARDTKVLLHHLGQDYYFDKIWIQGKDYGYEFPLPDNVKSRQQEQMAAVTVPAQYTTMAAQTNTASTTETTAAQSATTSQSTTAQSATNSQGTTAQSATNGQSTTAQSAANGQSTTAQSAANGQGTTAQSAANGQGSTAQSANTTPTTTAQTAQPQTTTGQSTMPPTTTRQSTMDTANSANRSASDTTTAPTTMPSTSAGWLMMLLGGTSLSGIGAALRRKR
jgi:hypothetical protein